MKQMTPLGGVGEMSEKQSNNHRLVLHQKQQYPRDFRRIRSRYVLLWLLMWYLLESERFRACGCWGFLWRKISRGQHDSEIGNPFPKWFLFWKKSKSYAEILRPWNPRIKEKRSCMEIFFEENNLKEAKRGKVCSNLLKEFSYEGKMAKDNSKKKGGEEEESLFL